MRALIFAVISLIALATATWQAQARLNDLRLLEVKSEIARTQALVEEVRRDALQKGESRAEKQAQVLYVFSVEGQEYRGALLVKDDDVAPAKGDSIAVVYAIKNPEIYLLESQFAELSRHIQGMQWVMALLGLATLCVPFMIAGFGRRFSKRQGA